MPIFFVRLPELLEQLAVGKTTLYARIKQGTFPPPVKFGERVSAWPEHEVNTVVNAYMRSATQEDLQKLVAQLMIARRSGCTGTK